VKKVLPSVELMGYDNRTNAPGSTGEIMMTVSFSKGIVEGLHQELVKAHELNNLRLSKLAQGLVWVNEDRSLRETGR
jgi:hypothetical protein